LDNNLLLCIENDNAPPGLESAAFMPRSIYERAESLGGRVSVEQSGANRIVICVQIPL
jgi:signal transduction histidine kinase